MFNGTIMCGLRVFSTNFVKHSYKVAVFCKMYLVAWISQHSILTIATTTETTHYSLQSIWLHGKNTLQATLRVGIGSNSFCSWINLGQTRMQWSLCCPRATDDKGISQNDFDASIYKLQQYNVQRQELNCSDTFLAKYTSFFRL